MKTQVLAALMLPMSLFAAAPPLLEISSGLPGKQVRLTWPAETGIRYRIERSAELSANWNQVALVQPDGSAGEWLDTEATTSKAFYRILQPQAEFFGISLPVLTTAGGDLRILGQLIPPGSFLVLEIEGQPPLLVPLSSLGNGEWQALVSGAFAAGSLVTAVRIEDGSGNVLLNLNQTITVTETGRASDSPSALPPAAPLPQQLSNPIPSIGVVVKSNGPKSGHRGMAPGAGGGDAPAPVFAMDHSDHYTPQGINSAKYASKKGYDYYAARYFSKKGYDSWKAHSDMRQGGDQGSATSNPLFEGGARPTAAPSGLPGEVSFQASDLSLPCPAGPALAWIRTYRSMAPVSSGHGTEWDFSYNIRVESIPAVAGPSASRVIIRDGGGRADIFHRQADGTFRCDGMFREGRFVGANFVLTFADKGTWTFRPFDRSSSQGKISAITDRNGVALSCSYDAAGQLANVADAFGRRIDVEWGSSPARILSVSTASGATIFSKVTYTYADPDQRLAAASAPFIPGQPPVAGAITYTYSSGSPDPRLNGNLLSVTDGAGRLLEAFTYSPVTNPQDTSYDTWATHDANRSGGGGGLEEVMISHWEALPGGGSQMTVNDELGRVSEYAFDKLHRLLRGRRSTGFATPGVPVTSTTNRPTGKLRAGDPDFFEFTCSYNADSLCTRIILEDGSQELATYDRDFRKDCPVRERGNPRVITLRSPGGESRTVRCDYEPGFGNPEPAQIGPIKGVIVKGGHNHRASFATPGVGLPQAREARPGRNPQTGKASRVSGGGLTGMDDWDTQNDYVSSGGGITAWDDWESPVVGRMANGIFNDDGDQGETFSSKGTGIKQKAWLCSNFRVSMVNAHGQKFSSSYDAHGNCTSASPPLSGAGSLFEYNALGQCTSATLLNGAAGSLRDECTYDPATRFLSSVIRDKNGNAGLQLTTAFERDPQGRVIRIVEPGGADWLYAYNPLDMCIQIQSPGVPARMSTNLTVDAGGSPLRCETTHLRPDGSPDPTNPLYSTFTVYDSRGRLIRIAEEERPVDCTGLTTPDAAGIENFAVCDLTYDAAGQCVSLSTPAACRGQTTDLTCASGYDERGLLFRHVEGTPGSPDAITTECDYDASGALLRCATLASGGVNPQILFAYDGFHRLSSITDPMGNQTTFGYGNDGFVLTSVYGELLDLPGSTNNVLMSRTRSNMGSVQSNPLYVSSAKHAINTKGTGATNGKVARNILKSFFETGDKPTQAQRTAGNPFFDVAAEDDTCIAERFTPGAPGSPVTEATTVDRSPAGLPMSVTCNGDTLLTLGYDSAGRQITCNDGYSTWAYTLNANGGELICGRTDHFFVQGTPDKTFTVSRVLDKLGRCISTTDGSENTSSFAYDSLGRCVSFTNPAGLTVLTAYDGTSAAGPFSIQVSADADGGEAEVLSTSFSRCGELITTASAQGVPTTLIRDSLGRVTRRNRPDGTYESCSYDSLGALHESRSPDGSVCHFTTDLARRVTGVEWSNIPVPVAPLPPASYAYDGLDRCVQAAIGSSLVTFAFDSCGNPVSETADGRTIQRSFTHRGRSGITYPDGRRFVEARDAAGKLLSTSSVNSGGIQNLPPVLARKYAGPHVWRSTQANGVLTEYTYRGDGESPLPGAADFSFDACVRSKMSVSGGSIVLNNSTVYRAPDQQITHCGSVFSAEPMPAGRSKTYEYDALRRMTGCVTKVREVSGGPVLVESSVSHVLDLDGHRISATGGGNPGSYTQNDALPPGDRQMGQYTSWPGGPITWDDNGNLASIATGANGRQITCHPGYHVSSISDGAGKPIVTYQYDALGRRIGRNPQTGKASVFVYDGSTCIQELQDDGSGTLSPSLSFVAGGGVPICITTRDGTSYYPSGNRLEHWGDPHENLNGKHIKDWEGKQRNSVTTWGDPHENLNGKNKVEHWGDPHENLNGLALMTSSTGEVLERFDCDDAGKPLFLNADGTRSAASSATTPIRWMAPEAIWESEAGVFVGTASVYSPDLGRSVAGPGRPRHGGHVTILK